MIVTIDGPAGTGKSTVARLLATQLGFEFLNTGAMYRAIALACLQHGVPHANEAAVVDVARNCTLQFQNQRMLLNQVDVTDELFTSVVTEAASFVAAHPPVREQLVALQRLAGQGANLVTEGRDQGTIVFPNAECKFFLTAQAEVRAQRRAEELAAAGKPVEFSTILAEQQERDERDRTRSIAPLCPAPDAIVVDTSTAAVQDVVQQLAGLVMARKVA